MVQRKGRQVSGLLLFDKSPGLSSNRALQEVKRLFEAAKAGHTGTLDPLATGLLLICLGKATKLAGSFLGADKTYLATVRFGVKTDSGDADGRPVRERFTDLPSALEVTDALRAFRGEIAQIPPMYSALKRGGVPLYKLARAGIEVPREPRRVSIHDIEMCSWRERECDLRIRCSSGTYIRALADDLGDALGCGAHLGALRRLAVGSQSLADAVTVEALRERKAREGLPGLDQLLVWPASDSHCPAQ